MFLLLSQISKSKKSKSNVNYILGAYTPVTVEGNIVVDGVLASCYASTDHDLGHFGMKPVHWFPDIVEIIFGDDIESSAYANIIASGGKYLLPNENKNGLN